MRLAQVKQRTVAGGQSLISSIRGSAKVSVPVGVVALVVIIVFVVPQLLVPTEGLQKDQLIKARNDARSGLLTALALGGAFIGGYVGLRQLELAREQLQHNLEASRGTLDLTRRGQLTERFTRAIDQLGSDKLDVRIGGIYALERIARDSKTDHGPIMEILTTYVREHSPWPPVGTGECTAQSLIQEVSALRIRAADVQAALTVVGRRTVAHEKDTKGIDLSSVDHRRADLRSANLRHADLRGANLGGADLRGADLLVAHLQDANLGHADLGGANLRGAKLGHADLRGANLQGAKLGGADLLGADLRGADLRNAQVGDDQIAVGVIDETTKLRNDLDEGEI
jgi:hypothetical protein